jgi:hypothetical protein
MSLERTLYEVSMALEVRIVIGRMFRRLKDFRRIATATIGSPPTSWLLRQPLGGAADASRSRGSLLIR